jgi:phospholipase C
MLNGTADITLYHVYSDDDPEGGTQVSVPKFSHAGPYNVHFETGVGTGFDYWYCSALVTDGPSPGFYQTQGTAQKPTKECMLQSEDAGTELFFEIDIVHFNINVYSPCKTSVHFKPRITNVFVLMLENRSFDHLFGFADIPGVNGLTVTEKNTYDVPIGKNEFETFTYYASMGATDPMPTDPGHEFLDTLEQLCGQGVVTYPDPATSEYPAINNSGFAANYATSDDENTGLPDAANIEDVMNCCTTSQIPVMYQLAQEFAICDNWFSSMPGPTWPNRLFAMGASSDGLDDTPGGTQIAWWQLDGVDYPRGSIFDRMNEVGVGYKLYNDDLNSFAANPAWSTDGGSLTIVQALADVNGSDIVDIHNLATDIKKDYPYRFTFIEPNYGNVVHDTYSGGSSQHAMDSLAGGEALIKYVYGVIRNSPIWNTSLLIITYDEHGGFYDHVAPPSAKAPDDGAGPGSSLNTHGFDFKQLGVRVPAVIVSPLIPKGTVDHTVYDHTSILKTIEDFYNMAPLTQRDGFANTVARLLTLAEARTDCPSSLTVPAPAPAPQAETVDFSAKDAEPLPEKGNIHGFLYVAAKTDVELSGGGEAIKAAVRARLESIQTRGQAREYLKEVMAKLKAARDAKAKTGLDG